MRHGTVGQAAPIWVLLALGLALAGCSALIPDPPLQVVVLNNSNFDVALRVAWPGGSQTREAPPCVISRLQFTPGGQWELTAPGRRPEGFPLATSSMEFGMPVEAVEDLAVIRILLNEMGDPLTVDGGGLRTGESIGQVLEHCG
jgi:hypothetical protein